MTPKDNLPISFFFPVYNDAPFVRQITELAIEQFSAITDQYEIVIVDDCSPDGAGKIADELAKQYPQVSVVHHPTNLGYGSAIKSGIKHTKYDLICMIDGDHEYDISDLIRMIRLQQFYGLIIGFRYKKMYSAKRIFISYVYNTTLRFLFKSKFRDISTGIRVFHRSILQGIELKSNSPFIGAELAIKSMLNGIPVGEVGIQTFPRTFGSGSATSFKNIVLTIRDMLKMRQEVFSDTYQIPSSRKRQK